MPEFVIHYECCIRPQDTIAEYVAVCELALVMGNPQQKRDFKRHNEKQFIEYYAAYPDELDGLLKLLKQVEGSNTCVY